MRSDILGVINVYVDALVIEDQSFAFSRISKRS